MKKRLIELKHQLSDMLKELDDILTSESIKSVVIKDGDWVESAKAVIESFTPRAELFMSKLSKIVEKLPSERRGRKKIVK